MQLFIDTAEIEEIKSLNITGLIDGVTTNPSLIAKSGRNIISTIEEICNEVSGPVSAEVTATDFDNMILEGKKLSSIAQNVTIKVPNQDKEGYGLAGVEEEYNIKKGY